MKRVVAGAAVTAAPLLASTAQAALQYRDLDCDGQIDAFLRHGSGHYLAVRGQRERADELGHRRRLGRQLQLRRRERLPVAHEPVIYALMLAGPVGLALRQRASAVV